MLPNELVRSACPSSSRWHIFCLNMHFLREGERGAERGARRAQTITLSIFLDVYKDVSIVEVGYSNLIDRMSSTTKKN